MVQVLQRGRLNQVAVHNLDMHGAFNSSSDADTTL